MINSILLLISKKVKTTVKIISLLSGLGGIAIGWLSIMLSLAFIDETLFKEQVYQDFYLTYSTFNDRQQRQVTVTIENPIYAKRNIRPDLDGWEVPEKIKFISFKDSVLKFSTIKDGKENTVEVDTRFDWTDRLFNGVRVVVRDGKKGAIDSTGKILIPLGKYETLDNNYNGLMLAWKNGKTGYVDRNGNVIIPFKFDGGGNFLDDSATVHINKKAYWINKKGEILCRAPYYDEDD
ncbi:MAG: WG repeat-containing protein [Bacteroidota bacterium]